MAPAPKSTEATAADRTVDVCPRLKVVICGAGIAGLSTALLLREDHDVTIVESSGSNEEIGAAVTLSVNASRLLRASLTRAGFDAVKARYVEAETFQELDSKDLSVIREFPMKAVTAKYHEPWWYFSRKDLHTELKRAALASDGLGTAPQLVLGAHVDRVDLESRTVFTRDGRSFKGDIIVGADGIRSHSGNSVFGRLATESQGFSAYRSMVASDVLRQDPETAELVDEAKIMMVVGPNRRVIAYPCSNWRWMNFVCIFPDEDHDKRLQWTTKVNVQEIVERFEDFHPTIVKALTKATDTGVWHLRDREPLSTLVKGCYVLIGDAAHAMGPHQGQGACQAIEDAEALRIVLKGAAAEDAEERLRIFDEVRAERVATAVNYSRATAPKAKIETAVEPKHSASFNDYYWEYKVTLDAVAKMTRHGFPLRLEDESTGEISLAA